MIARSVLEDIRKRVSPREVLELEGYAVNRQGFAKCPFHADGDASLKVYPDGRGWYCFGCHAGGDVIKLVEHLHSIGFQAALMRLDMDFHLGIYATSTQSRRNARIAARKEAAYKCRMAWLEAEIERLERDYWWFEEQWLDCQRKCDYAVARVDHGGEFTQEDADNFWDVLFLREAAQYTREKWKEAISWRPLMREDG